MNTELSTKKHQFQTNMVSLKLDSKTGLNTKNLLRYAQRS